MKIGENRRAVFIPRRGAKPIETTAIPKRTKPKLADYKTTDGPTKLTTDLRRTYHKPTTNLLQTYHKPIKPTTNLPQNYWLPIGFLLVSYWLPIGFLLVSYWLPIGFLLAS